MIMKLLKLQLRIYFWIFTGKINKLNSRLFVSFKKGEAKKILIIFPMDESSFRVANYAFRDLGKNNKSQQSIKYIIKEQFKDLFQFHSGSLIMIKNSHYDNMLSDEMRILEQVQNTKYDIIIDLNSNFHLGIARLISFLKGDIKIGFFNPFSDLFYNLQLDISKSGIVEKGYKQINIILEP